MKKIIYMSIFTTLLTLFGCKSKEESFLQKNIVIYYGTKEFEEFEKKSNVKLVKAWQIQKEYLEKNNQLSENWLFFVINDSYVFNSAVNPKEAKVFLKGLWVDSKTGEVKLSDSKIRLTYGKAYNGDAKQFPF